jgi:hypothetical protein
MTRLFPLALLALVSFVLLCRVSLEVGLQLANADSGSAVSSSSPPATSAPAAAPADKLHDPVTQPAQALDDVVAAKKLGWPLFVLACLLLGARAAGELGKSVSWLAWLSKGRAAFVVAGAATVAAACFNTVALGGHGMAILAAAAGAALALLRPVAKDQPAPASS